MENVENIRDTPSDETKSAEMRSGANWFYWIAVLSVINSLIAAFGSNAAFLVGLGATQYVDVMAGQSGSAGARWAALVVNIAIAGVFAAFGYFARKGSDIAFIIGMFLYFADALLMLAYRDIWAFAFHILALFFMFKGLLASRKRSDPSV